MPLIIVSDDGRDKHHGQEKTSRIKHPKHLLAYVTSASLLVIRTFLLYGTCAYPSSFETLKI